MPALINAACAWASELDQLQDLYQSPFTGAVTTRTATLDGFVEDSQSHMVALTKDTKSSLNSYGYSPHPLATYLIWIETIIRSDPSSSKPFIISITTSSPSTPAIMLDAIMAMRAKLNNSSRVAIELNTSCPNIQGSPPPAYQFPSLVPVLTILSEYFKRDTTLTIGLKLPPYVYTAQFDAVIHSVSSFSYSRGDHVLNPFAFFTCTNTLGSCLLFAEQTIPTTPDALFAVPTRLGALGGESIHALSLGNVYIFTRLLESAQDEAVRRIVVIGVGGVTTPEAVERMQNVRAKVVGCATILGRHGVTVFEKLSAGLKV